MCGTTGLLASYRNTSNAGEKCNTFTNNVLYRYMYSGLPPVSVNPIGELTLIIGCKPKPNQVAFLNGRATIKILGAGLKSAISRDVIDTPGHPTQY